LPADISIWKFSYCTQLMEFSFTESICAKGTKGIDMIQMN